ncbi:MAG: MFS transporter [candidate division KSB1 bacterium]|jgi:MFS family permease|nr:MFS transporter [candidate division KSB1 bacterium]
MRFDTKAELTDQDVQSGLKNVVRDGITSQTMLTLTSGVFLIAYALEMGASNLAIGIIAAIPPLSQLFQIPSIYLVEKYRARKKITFFSAVTSRFFLLLIALIPFFVSMRNGLIMLTTMLLLHTSINAVVVCSWNSWMRDLVPQDRLGTFFSTRLKYSLIPAMLLSLSAGLFIDAWENYTGLEVVFCYSVLFVLGFFAGMIGTAIIYRIPEPKMVRPEQRIPFLELLTNPFKDRNYKKLIMFLGSWNFAVNLAAPFFTVYLLRRLNYGMGVVMGLTVLSQFTYFTFVRVWGRIADRFSNKSVLVVSGNLFMICILLWTFTTLPEKYFLTMPLLIVIHVFMGVSIAGIALSSGNIGLKLAPKGEATSYLAAHNLINSMAAGFAPIIGGTFADFFTKREFSWAISWSTPRDAFMFETLNFRGLDFFFFFAFLIGLYSLHRLSIVQETGDVKEKVVIDEFFSMTSNKLRNLSTAGGLRYMHQFPERFSRSKRRRKKGNTNK